MRSILAIVLWAIVCQVDGKGSKKPQRFRDVVPAANAEHLRKDLPTALQKRDRLEREMDELEERAYQDHLKERAGITEKWERAHSLGVWGPGPSLGSWNDKTAPIQLGSRHVGPAKAAWGPNLVLLVTFFCEIVLVTVVHKGKYFGDSIEQSDFWGRGDFRKYVTKGIVSHAMLAVFIFVMGMVLSCVAVVLYLVPFLFIGFLVMLYMIVLIYGDRVPNALKAAGGVILINFIVHDWHKSDISIETFNKKIRKMSELIPVIGRTPYMVYYTYIFVFFSFRLIVVSGAILCGMILDMQLTAGFLYFSIVNNTFWNGILWFFRVDATSLPRVWPDGFKGPVFYMLLVAFGDVHRVILKKGESLVAVSNLQTYFLVAPMAIFTTWASLWNTKFYMRPKFQMMLASWEMSLAWYVIYQLFARMNHNQVTEPWRLIWYVMQLLAFVMYIVPLRVSQMREFGWRKWIDAQGVGVEGPLFEWGTLLHSLVMLYLTRDYYIISPDHRKSNDGFVWSLVLTSTVFYAVFWFLAHFRAGVDARDAGLAYLPFLTFTVKYIHTPFWVAFWYFRYSDPDQKSPLLSSLSVTQEAVIVGGSIGGLFVLMCLRLIKKDRFMVLRIRPDQISKEEFIEDQRERLQRGDQISKYLKNQKWYVQNMINKWNRRKKRHKRSNNKFEKP